MSKRTKLTVPKFVHLVSAPKFVRNKITNPGETEFPKSNPNKSLSPHEKKFKQYQNFIDQRCEIESEISRGTFEMKKIKTEIAAAEKEVQIIESLFGDLHSHILSNAVADSQNGAVVEMFLRDVVKKRNAYIEQKTNTLNAKKETNEFHKKQHANIESKIKELIKYNQEYFDEIVE